MPKLASLPARPRSTVQRPGYPRALYAALVSASVTGCNGVLDATEATASGGGRSVVGGAPNLAGGMVAPFESGGESSLGGAGGVGCEPAPAAGCGAVAPGGTGGSAIGATGGAGGWSANPTGGEPVPFTTGGSSGTAGSGSGASSGEPSFAGDLAAAFEPSPADALLDRTRIG